MMTQAIFKVYQTLYIIFEKNDLGAITKEKVSEGQSIAFGLII